MIFLNAEFPVFYVIARSYNKNNKCFETLHILSQKENLTF